MERSITKVAIFLNTALEASVSIKVCVLQIAPYKTGSLQFHLSKRAYDNRQFMEFHRQAEAVAEAEGHSCRILQSVNRTSNQRYYWFLLMKRLHSLNVHFSEYNSSDRLI